MTGQSRGRHRAASAPARRRGAAPHPKEPHAESRRIFNGGATLPWNSSWIDLDARCPEHPEGLPWRELLGDFSPPPVLAFTSAGKPVRLAKKDEAIDALLRNGIDLDALRRRADPVDDAVEDGDRLDGAVDAAPSVRAPRDPADARFAADVARSCRQRVLAAVVAAAEAAPPDDNRFASLVYETMLHGGYHNAVVDTVKRRLGKVPKGEQPAVALARIASGLAGGALRALVLELCVSRGGYFVTGGDRLPRDLAHAAALYGIDAAFIEKAVAEELAAKRAARRG